MFTGPRQVSGLRGVAAVLLVVARGLEGGGQLVPDGIPVGPYVLDAEAPVGPEVLGAAAVPARSPWSRSRPEVLGAAVVPARSPWSWDLESRLAWCSWSLVWSWSSRL